MAPEVRRKIRDWFPKREITVNREEIKEILPHRGNKFLLDRAVISPKVFRGELLIRDELCVGHEIASGRPVFRGVDIPEMAAQLVGFVWGHQHPSYRDMIGMLNGIDRVKIRKPIFPGDILVVEIDPAKVRQKIFGGPETETMRVVLIAREISARVKKEKKASVGSLKIVIISPESFNASS